MRQAGGFAPGLSVDCLLPAAVNLHSHMFQRAMAGMTEKRGARLKDGSQDSFWTWRTLMYRFLDRLSPEDVQAIAAIPEMNELNIGHAIIGRAVFTGLPEAVAEMKRLMVEARQ